LVSAHRFDQATRLFAMSPTIATFNPLIFPGRSRIVARSEQTLH
jgi:hypothetical protein